MSYRKTYYLDNPSKADRELVVETIFNRVRANLLNYNVVLDSLADYEYNTDRDISLPAFPEDLVSLLKSHPSLVVTCALRLILCDLDDDSSELVPLKDCTMIRYFDEDEAKPVDESLKKLLPQVTIEVGG